MTTARDAYAPGRGTRGEATTNDADNVTADLTVWHRKMLIESSGIATDVVEERGYWSATDADRRELIKLNIPRDSINGTGLVIPIYTLTGREDIIQWRPDKPQEDPDNPGKVRKYLNPHSTPNVLDVHPCNHEDIEDETVDLWITEGVKKADALTSHGLCTIALSGIWNWRGKPHGPLGDWEYVALDGRKVYLVPDSDTRTNSGVASAVRDLGAFLASRGARVRYVIPPPAHDGSKQGADDFLVAGGSIAELRALADYKPPADDRFKEKLVREELLRREVRRAADAAEKPSPKPVDVVLLDALFDEEIPKPKYRIGGLWPSPGRVVTTAPKKSGKTTMVGNLVRSQVDGVPFLDSFEVQPIAEGKRVAVIDFEMGRDQVQRWLWEQDIKNVHKVALFFMRGMGTWDIRDDRVREEWAQKLRDADVETLIIDPLGPILQGLGIEENSNTEVGGLLFNIDRLAVDAGIDDLMVVHHAGHEGERGRGASTILGWPDAIWQIVRDDPNSDVMQTFFKAHGRDVDVKETALLYDYDTRHLGLGMGNRKQAKLNGKGESVEKIVESEPGISARRLEQKLMADQVIGSPAARAAIKDAVGVLIHTHPGPNNSNKHFPQGVCPGVSECV